MSKLKRVTAALCGSLFAVGGIILTSSPVQATDSKELPAEAGFVIKQTNCEEGGEVTVTADSIPYLVSSGMRTAGLSIRVNGEVTYTQPKEMPDGEGVFNGYLTVGPFTEDTKVEYRWFAGPTRDDLPAWDLAGNWADVVTQREDDEERHWDARDDAEFVKWYSVDVKGCPEPTPSPTTESPSPTPTPTATESPVAGSGGGDGGEEKPGLPVTGSSLPVYAGAGVALLVLGAGLYLLTRKRRGVELTTD